MPPGFYRHPKKKEEPEPEYEPNLTPEEVKVISWRISCLCQAGVDPDVAGDLAAIHDLDLHKAVEMKRAGCGQELMLRILR